MESRKDIILVITHTIALTTGFLCGYYINNKLKSSNEENLATNSGVYYCDVFDDKGNHKITNYYINEDTFTIHFEEKQLNISFVITRNGKEVANVENFNGMEHKFIN